jgi:hypothetical protein
MATGPFTLLVNPPAGTYEDAAGSHELDWHGPVFVGNPVGFPQDPAHAVAFTMPIHSYPETIVNRHGMFGGGTPLNDWTVTNGTKASQSYSATRGKFATSNHFQSAIYGARAHGVRCCR